MALDLSKPQTKLLLIMLSMSPADCSLGLSDSLYKLIVVHIFCILSVVVKSQTTVTDKVRNRLEQLDDFEEGSVQEMLNLSQQEYVYRIEELNSALILAWDQDQRVKALKIAIQVQMNSIRTSQNQRLYYKL